MHYAVGDLGTAKGEDILVVGSEETALDGWSSAATRTADQCSVFPMGPRARNNLSHCCILLILQTGLVDHRECTQSNTRGRSGTTVAGAERTPSSPWSSGNCGRRGMRDSHPIAATPSNHQTWGWAMGRGGGVKLRLSNVTSNSLASLYEWGDQSVSQILSDPPRRPKSTL